MNALLPAELDGQPRPAPMTVAMLRALDDAGLFIEETNRHELLDGVLLVTPPPGGEHRKAERRTTMALAEALIGAGLHKSLAVQTGGAFQVGEATLLGPDLMVVRESGMADTPDAAAIVLMIEIALSSRAFDLGRKAAVYAAAGIAEYWVLDVAAEAVIVHTRPREGAWGRVETVEGEAVVCATLAPAIAVRACDLF
jgi:Uma2 family endonuclease